MIDRRDFGPTIEARPGLTMRRLTLEEAKKANWLNGEPVGIFNVYGHKKLVAVVEFDDLFDPDGNRFNND